MKYEVFISFKNSGRNGQPTPDAAAARTVHEALKQRGVAAFFSEESLAEKGQGHFGKAIESALDSAKVLILVASCRDHIESRWVEAEWDSFLQDVRSGNKEGELFILDCGNLKPTDLPLFLRRQQMFRLADLEKMLSFVASAMSPQVTLNDLIELSLHCHNPKKNEDKVYLMTVQQGTSAATRNVVAHWGARAAKRLSSQVKAINVAADAAKAEVEKARLEKQRGGYAQASHAGLLTPEAWTFLSASLGVVDAPPREKPSDVGAGGKKTKVKVPAPAREPTKATKTKATKTLPPKPVSARSAATSAVPSSTPVVKKTRPLQAPAPQPAAKTPAKAAASKAAASKTAKTDKSASPVKPAKPAIVVKAATHVPKAAEAPAGGTVCISGKLLSGKKKADYTQSLVAVGLRLVDDVSKELKYLVVADPSVPTSKADKARKLGIPILSEEGLIALVAKLGKARRRK
jgi:predicted DNA-binding WGR domain protein